MDDNKYVPKRHYQPKWEQNAELKDWLAPVKNDKTKAFCKVCYIPLTAKIYHLKSHAKSAKHLQYVERKKQRKESPFLPQYDFMKRACFIISACMAHENIPYRKAQRIIDHFANAFNMFEPLQNLKLGRTKVKKLVGVMAKCHFEETAEKLKTEKFCVVADEFVDISTFKNLSICVRFFDNSSNTIINRFWNLEQICPKDVTDYTNKDIIADYFLHKMETSFQTAGVPVSNMIGFTSDGSNDLCTGNNSILSRIAEKYPNVITNRCICDILQVCASKSLKDISKICENLPTTIYNYLKSNGERVTLFKEFQVFLQTQVQKILKPCTTRWLSTLQVVERLLKQWDALIKYFDSESVNNDEAKEILFCLTDNITRAHFKFFMFLSKKFATVHKLVETESVIIHEIDFHMKSLYSELYRAAANIEDFTPSNIKLINPMDIDSISPIYKINRKNVIKPMESDLTPHEQSMFRSQCKQSLIKACGQIQSRYLLTDSFFSAASLISPKIALSKDASRPQTLHELISKCPFNLNQEEIQSIDYSWKIMLNTLPENWISKEITDFWNCVRQFEIAEKKAFEVIGNFVLNILIQSHSTACCGRVNAASNAIKSKDRANLSGSTIKSSLLTSELISLCQNPENFQPTTKMLNMK